ncbi:MAG: hypothetical protein IT548_18440 [Alphaproteobacteria bacterium]|nr:hypothetical protein [Alphaproteobacteria bacterium]
MPKLVRFLVRHALTGVGLGVAFAAYLILADVGGLGTLILASPDRVLVISLLLVGMSITFGSAQMGIAVMLLASRDGDDTGTREKAAPPWQIRTEPVPIVRARPR